MPNGRNFVQSLRQIMRDREYPETPLLDPNKKFKKGVVAELKNWNREFKPFRDKEYSEANKTRLLDASRILLNRLSGAYGIRTPELKFENMTAQSWNEASSSGSSFYEPGTHSITLQGKFSLITLLHEFGHARGFGEHGAVSFSTNLFSRVFPVSTGKLIANHHVLTRPAQSANKEVD
jgi:hypothetical protein